MFLLIFSVTNRINSCSMTSSSDNNSSYGLVMTLSSSSRKVMHSLTKPCIFGTRSRSAKDWSRFLTDISKLRGR